MKRIKIVALVLALLLVAPIAFADTVTKTLTFQWEYNNPPSYLKDFKIYWSETAGGPYDTTPVSTIPYTGQPGPTFTGDASQPVTGNPGTIVTKYFVCIACGDVPQQDGTTKYLCSDNSNEVSYDFWIPAAGFTAPITFQIIPTGGE